MFMFLSAWIITQYRIVTENLQTYTAPRYARTRGVSMLEYVLIAGVVLVIAGVFSVVFRDAIGDLINKVGDAITNNDSQ